MYGVKAHGKHLKRNEEFLHILYRSFRVLKNRKIRRDFLRIFAFASGQRSGFHEPRFTRTFLSLRTSKLLSFRSDSAQEKRAKLKSRRQEKF